MEDTFHNQLRTLTTTITLLANTPAEAESPLHSIERAAGGICLHLNADKTKYMYFNQRGDISPLKSGALKLVIKLNYLGSCVSSRKTSTRDQEMHGQLSIANRLDESQT